MAWECWVGQTPIKLTLATNRSGRSYVSSLLGVLSTMHEALLPLPMHLLPHVPVVALIGCLQRLHFLRQGVLLETQVLGALDTLVTRVNHLGRKAAQCLLGDLALDVHGHVDVVPAQAIFPQGQLPTCLLPRDGLGPLPARIEALDDAALPPVVVYVLEAPSESLHSVHLDLTPSRNELFPKYMVRI